MTSFFPTLLLALLGLSLFASVSAHTWVHCTKYRANSGEDFANYNDGLCAGYPRGWTAQDNLPFGATNQDFVHTYPLFNGGPPFQAMYFDYPGRQGEFRACFKDSVYNGRYQPATYSSGERVCLAYPSQNHVPDRGCTYNPFTDLGQRIFYKPAGQDPTIREVDGLPSIELPPYGSNCPNYCQNTQQSLCTACFTVPQLSEGRYTFIWRWNSNRLQSPFNPFAPPITPVSYFTCWEANIQGSGASNQFQLGPAVDAVNVLTDYYITPTHAPDQCIDAAGVDNGAHVILYPCNGGDNQKWSAEIIGSYIVLKDKRSGRALDVPPGNSQGNKAHLWEKHNGINQQIQLLNEGPSKFGMRMMMYGDQWVVLDVPNWGKDGVQIQTWERVPGTNQIWTFHRA